MESNGRRGRGCQDDVGLQTDQLLRERPYPIDVSAAPTNIHPHVAAIGPTQVSKRLSERRIAKFPLRTVYMSTPIRRMRSACCAHTTSGHAAALPSPAMKVRRLTESPHRRWPAASQGW
jgi:hypothetical protein